jgi:hypothetical protein
MIENFASCQRVGAKLHVVKVGYANLRAKAIRRLGT